jgi:DHA1 family bicyclomycin/chloramphenicol resistance-like MFS transporter
MLAALAIAPMIAPSIGSVLLAWFGWRAIFATLALWGLVLFVIAHRTLSETHPLERRLVATPMGLVRGFRTFFTTPGTRLPMLIGVTSFAGQFAYIADSPFVYMQGFHVSDTTFSILFGLTALALMIGSILGGSMLRAGRSPGTMVVIGTGMLVVGGIAVTVGTRGDFGIAGFLVPMIIYFLGVGLAQPSAVALALEPVPHIAGTASAAIGFLTMIAGAIAGYGTTKLGGSDPHAFAKVVAVMAVVAAGLAGITAWSRHRRRTR